MARVHYLPVVPVLLAAGVSVFAACGDEEPTTPDVTIDTYLKAYDDALCTYVVKCGQAPDAATCHKVFGPDPEVAQAVTSVLFGTLQFDEAAAQECLKTVTDAVCQVPYGYPFPAEITTKCNAVFQNGAKENDPCYVGLECLSGFCKTPNNCGDACCVGQCTNVSTNVPEGGDCSKAACVPEDYCATDAMMMKTCKPRVQPNDICPQADACLLGYRCDVASNKCFKLAASGAQCNPDLSVSPCLSEGEFCDKDKKTCGPYPQAGQPCTPDAACARDAFCDASAMQCIPLPAAGEMCPQHACIGKIQCDDMGTMMCGQLEPVFTCLPPVVSTGAAGSTSSTGTGM